MKDKVFSYLTENIKISNNNLVIILGVSGGADSVVLLDILSKLNYKLIVAHCNFQLRNEESERDACFVKQLCQKYHNVRFVQKKFDTSDYAQNNSISIEMAARILRYEWFEKLRLEYSANYIAVGHHKDDTIETIILNLIRGTGIKGLTGIKSKMEYIIRPLLCLSKSDIENYIINEHLEFITDSSNLESIYARNIIRLEILPLFKKINKNYRKTILQTIDNLREVEKIYQIFIQKEVTDILKNNKINIQKLKESASPISILYEILSPLGFKSPIIYNILDSLDNESGKLFFSDSNIVLKDRDELIIKQKENNICNETEIVKINENDTLIYHPNKISFEIIPVRYISNFKTPANILLVDFDTIQYPLILRKWNKGDTFYPLGLKGKKQKVSDYFTNNKFSIFEKEKTWILTSSEKIIWIVKHRMDDRFKITERTKTVLRIEWDDEVSLDL